MPELIPLRVVVVVDRIKSEIVGLDQTNAGNPRQRRDDPPLDPRDPAPDLPIGHHRWRSWAKAKDQRCRGMGHHRVHCID